MPPAASYDALRLGGGPIQQSSLSASLRRAQVELQLDRLPPTEGTRSISRLINASFLNEDIQLPASSTF